ncbi:hypothetical protein CYLTODRAFT_460451 [Cylindrobasidium torrendii FP15055 ss-10]|uniref:Reverse transcriptase/retrotransposon-derived protein RNase H-like domain-containing protein n=1 Tax=Cylindrobasidium torrendii FP15055 ss-10 TaxID=1314674 RepID=A0A0D7ASF7_9AGAR|nr:hypothetical protein CYLTODRAFT_460451 [Cylindrobasidium torrendii FP15055 ss-10]
MCVQTQHINVREMGDLQCLLEWTDSQQRAFNKLKRHISEEPVLLLPDDHSKFRVEADSLMIALLMLKA